MAGRMKLSNAIRPPADLHFHPDLSLASAKLLAGGNGSDPAGRAD
jgi:hypothetical protein